MNQPPGGAPPNGQSKPFMGTQLMAGAPVLPMQVQQQLAATQLAPQAAAPQQAWPQAAPQAQWAPQAQPQQAMPGAPPAYGPPQGYGPPAAYGGAPMQQQQQQQQGVGMPQFGIGGFGPHGMPRIALGGGDFSPTKLFSAVFGGYGFAAPRKMGLIMMGLAFLLAVINSALVFAMHLYYPYLYSIGAIFWWGGLWLAVTGQPAARADGSKAPMWSRVGLAACLVWGILVGMSMCFFNWEHMLVGG